MPQRRGWNRTPRLLNMTHPGKQRRDEPRYQYQGHREFAQLRTTGEWFRYEEPLVGHIETLRDGQGGS